MIGNDVGTYYIIRIREKLDERWEEWFDGMSVIPDSGGTTIAGYLPDQAALHGMIARVQRLGLELVAVNRRMTTNGTIGPEIHTDFETLQ